MNFLGKEIGPNYPPFFVAELSCNHNGKLEEALLLIKAAKENGADAVKIQVYNADSMTIESDKQDFNVKDGPWVGRNIYELYTKTGTPFEWVPHLFSYAKQIEIPIFSSVFCERGLSILEQNKCLAYKIASFELNDTNLIRKVGKTGRPVVFSTGMANISEIDRAVALVQNKIIMHCVSAYPVRHFNANLEKIITLQRLYQNTPIGFSDHTTGMECGQVACALGASVVEKHFGLHGNTSEDSFFSISPEDFKLFTKMCITAWETMGQLQPNIEDGNRQFRRSLYTTKDIQAGEYFTEKNVRSIRPSYGLDPDLLLEIFYMRATKFIPKGTALNKEMLL